MISTPSDHMTIGRRLHWLLAIEGRLIRDLSNASGVPYGTLQQYMGDRRKPGAEHLTKLARAGINLHWLLLGYDEASLHLIFPNFEPLVGPLAADSELGSAFLREAFDAVDEFHRNWVQEHGEPLSVEVIFMSVWSVFSIYDKLLDNISDTIAETRSKGWLPNDIATFILTGPVRQEVRDRLRIEVARGAEASAGQVSEQVSR